MVPLLTSWLLHCGLQLARLPTMLTHPGYATVLGSTELTALAALSATGA